MSPEVCRKTPDVAGSYRKTPKSRRKVLDGRVDRIHFALDTFDGLQEGCYVGGTLTGTSEPILSVNIIYF